MNLAVNATFRSQAGAWERESLEAREFGTGINTSMPYWKKYPK
jgi:hypothetical protein